MDKFDRRPTKRSQRQKLLNFGLVFLGVGSWFAALFVFQNRGAPWLLAIYGVLLAVLAWMRFKEELGGIDLMRRSIPLQSVQGPGFSLMEVAAVQALVERAGTPISSHFKRAEVMLRWNTGSGCLTVIRSQNPVHLDDRNLGFVSWFDVRGLAAPVGCRFWAKDGSIDVMEFFCAGERSVDLDWHDVVFSPADTGDPRTIPTSRPTIDLDRLISLVRSQAA